MPSFKQNGQEYNANIVKVEKQLLPAILAATANNGQSLANWLIKNCVEGDVVDASVKNILQAVNALDAAKLIDWKIAPIQKPQKKRPDVLQSHDGNPVNHAKPDRPSEFDLMMGQERKRRERLGDIENGKLMSEAAALVRNHTNYPHSRAIRERDVLRKEFDRLVAAKTHPNEVLAALKAKQSEFDGVDVTRPHLGN
jgi:hypothetical protein